MLLMVSELAVTLLPLQPPDAVQAVAFVVDQERSEFPPEFTEFGVALNVMVGAGAVPGATVIATEDCPVVFAAPAQLSVKVLFAVSVSLVALPLVARAPDHAPDAVHDVASVELQVKVTDAPLETDVALAESVTVGVGCAGALGGAGSCAPSSSLPPPHPAISAHAAKIPAKFNVDLLEMFMTANEREVGE
jgi:hypothetical protein